MSDASDTGPLGDDVRWIDECYGFPGGHHHIAVYLIRHGEEYILVDAGAAEHRADIESRIDRITGEADPSAMILTHSDLPHVANVKAFRERWDLELHSSFAGSASSPEALGMGPANVCSLGETKRVLGRRFSFPWPPLVDAAHSMWIFDHATGTMFMADVGHYHRPGSCTAVWDGSDWDVDVELVVDYLRDALPFVHFLDPEKVAGAFERLLDEYEVRCLAPIHGNPVVGERNVEAYVSRYVEAIAQIGEEYDASV